jgi:ADP-heptose:LPS heptosyltransferase
LDFLNLFEKLGDLSRFILFWGAMDRIAWLNRVRISPKTLLIIRTDAIGDFMLWLDAAKEFRTLYPCPDYRITLLANRRWSDLARAMPHWDDVWDLDPKRFLRNPIYRLKMLKKTCAAGFETIIYPMHSREFFLGDAIVKVSGAKEKIGSSGDCFNLRPYQKHISDRYYTRLIPVSGYSLMELKRNAEFMRGFTCNDFKGRLPEFIPEGIDFHPLPRDFYVLFPGAGWEKRMWQVENFAHLSQRIYRYKGWTGVICGGPQEEKIGHKLKSISTAPLVDLTGKTSIGQLTFIIKKAKFLVGNETSAVHIAAALGTPCVCILGGGHFGRFMPYDLEVPSDRPLPKSVTHHMDCFGCNWICRYNTPRKVPVPCIARISLEQVWEEVSKILTLETIGSHLKY